MPHRFFAPGLTLAAPVALPDDEAEHLLRVLRLKVGDEVEAFDGAGGMFEAVVDRADRRGAAVRARRAVAAAPEPRVRLRLVMAVLKGDKMDDVVRDAAMLGVAEIQPVVTARSEVSLTALARGHRVQRWERIAISSVKQCGRAVVPVILTPLAFAPWLEKVSGWSRLLMVEPAAGVPAQPAAAIARPSGAEVIVGPEGGWTAGELQAAIEAGARPVTLGGRTLRADAAPLVALAALLTVWGES